MKNFLLLLTFIFLSAPHAVFAQEPSVPMEQKTSNAPVKSKPAPPQNVDEFTKLHFKKCLERDHLSLTKNDVESICGCSASNLPETLTFDEMKLLSKRSPEGKEARQKFIAYAYAPCLQYLIADMSKNDCLSGDLAKNIKVGKMSVCKCTEKKMVSIFERLAPTVMIEAVTQDPMTLDPIDSFLSSEAYFSQRDGYIKQCIYETAYKRDNR